MKPADHKIYLASKSPRRRELLRLIGVEFELLLLRDAPPRGPDVTEEVLEGEAPHDYVARVALEKAQFAADVIAKRRIAPRPALTADTTVVLDGRILGKPAGDAEAHAMLRALSGRSHQVLTSIAVAHQGRVAQVTHCSNVVFCEMSDAAIRQYCATREPFDKAGGYGIQGMAAQFIRHIEGSHSSIMGLPLFETAQLLKQAGIPLP